ncbi:sterile alpha motif domain-containing protein 1-like [Meriones unguiculatus]|uniref:sterile alpha motif domain-containing protein 1-like n=1 Tax=Meriones unguiculatus TaxID=10047 RepID=UPI00293E3480|nr:sterile alpha motif domain-containing protein 1-like [Meriones unguiculatus]
MLGPRCRTRRRERERAGRRGAGRRASGGAARLWTTAAALARALLPSRPTGPSQARAGADVRRRQGAGAGGGGGPPPVTMATAAAPTSAAGGRGGARAGRAPRFRPRSPPQPSPASPRPGAGAPSAPPPSAPSRRSCLPAEGQERALVGCAEGAPSRRCASDPVALQAPQARGPSRQNLALPRPRR